MRDCHHRLGRWLPLLTIISLSLPISFLFWLGEVNDDRPLIIPDGMRMIEDWDERVIVASLLACSSTKGGGIGNIVFEIISFHAIARKIGRIPALYSNDRVCLGKISSYVEHMPHLVEGFILVEKPRFFSYPSRYPKQECFDYFDPIDIFESLDHERIINTHLQYLQNMRFIDDQFGSEAFEKRLQFTDRLKEIAKLSTYPEKINGFSHNLCIHIRRGDFVNEKFHLESKADFTVDATKYILKKMLKNGGKRVRVFIVGQDPSWSKRIFGNESLPGETRLSIVNSPSYLPSMVDWAFSNLYCDSVLLTASISTYGFWMGVVSRGGEVFYRTKFSKFTPDYSVNLWPQSWTSIDY